MKPKRMTLSAQGGFCTAVNAGTIWPNKGGLWWSIYRWEGTAEWAAQTPWSLNYACDIEVATGLTDKQLVAKILRMAKQGRIGAVKLSREVLDMDPRLVALAIAQELEGPKNHL